MTKNEFIKELYEKYNFSKDEDIFVMEMGNRKIPIVTKTGMQKIISQEQFKYTFDHIHVSQDYCVVLCKVFSKEGEELSSSYGSAESVNVRNKAKYFMEMAEKRAKVRSVLIAVDAHGYLYSEEEADDFKKWKIFMQ